MVSCTRARGIIAAMERSIDSEGTDGNSSLDREIDAETRALLSRYGFDRSTFERLRQRLLRGEAEDEHNRLKATLAPPSRGDISTLAPLGSKARADLHDRGLSLIREGKVASVILAGGMATRFGGVVKAAVEVTHGLDFLSLKLRDVAQVARRVGTTMPVYVMTSFATDARITEMVAAMQIEGVRVQTFPQFVSLRLSADGSLFRDARGRPSLYATGHGDLVPALRQAGALSTLRTAGVQALFMSNVDNLAATLDPAVIGAHETQGADLTFEVARLAPGDKGGVPARLEGRLQVIEALRYPLDFEEQSIPLFSTNSFVLDTRAIDRDFDLSWFRVTKKVEGRQTVQFERLVNQLTAFVESHGLAIERDGPDNRFLPIKDPPDLEASRGTIESLLRARGAL